VRLDASATSRFASLDNLESVSGDSSAEMTVEQDDQTALATASELPTAQAEESAQEAVARPDADEQVVLAETNGHADSNGHGAAAQADAPALDTAVEQAPVAPASDEPADVPASDEPADVPVQASDDRPALPITPDVEKPAFGPRILGVAEPVKPLPPKKAAAPARKRRRRPSAAERHRRAFFAALTDLRRGGSGETQAEPVLEAEADAPEATPIVAATAPAVEQAAMSEAPAAETSAPEANAPESVPPEASAPEAIPPEASAPEAAGSAPEAPPAEANVAPAAEQVEPTPASEAPEPELAAVATAAAPVASGQADISSPARLTAAIERVGGPEVIKEALKPKQDEKGQPLKWAAVCAQAAEGLKPGDPVFNAWVRLAATPVREVKGHLPRPAEQARPAGRDSGRRSGGQRGGEGGRRDRPRRDDRSNRQEFASHAHDGTLRTSVRIVTGHDEDQERRERERVRKEQREAKRRAERERLARLGY